MSPQSLSLEYEADVTGWQDIFGIQREYNIIQINIQSLYQAFLKKNGKFKIDFLFKTVSSLM